jgi:hypothetical protein
MQKMVEKGRAPAQVDRIDKAHPQPGAKDHVHFKDGTSVNHDGTPHNSADFVRTRNPMDSLAGNGPILVLRDGSVVHLPSAVPWEDALKHLKRIVGNHQYQ